MTFRFDITDAEFSEYMKHYYKKNFTSRKWLYLLVSAVTMCACLFTSLKGDYSTKGFLQLLPLIMAFVILGGSFVLIFWLVSKLINYKNESSKWRIWLALSLVSAVIALLYFDYENTQPNEEGVKKSYAQPFLSWLFLATFMATVWSLVIRRLRNPIKQQDKEAILGEREMSFGEEQIEIRNANSGTQYRWEAIKKWEQTTHLYLLYISENIAIIIPKRIFESLEQESEFEHLLRRKLPNLTSGRYLDA
jgi:FlaA1/EpsC-like NDP-sugar epimerase